MNMATKAQIRRILENALGLIANALDNALEKEQKIADRIEVAGNETEIAVGANKANVGHLVNWTDEDNDNNLKDRIKKRFTREDIRGEK
ncbi:hypothetical protein RhiirA5_418999 [Rhizophagus irregularis]|uniref:Uncharacterized protein n=1 Tax=Rhizophagus irregularis TaxID=588596 RepID=A0A2N0PJ42_9GLOM|nr:hypothetical protein RhiirA5_418999 [Rhizophagus irregularis]